MAEILTSDDLPQFFRPLFTHRTWTQLDDFAIGDPRAIANFMNL
jgi:hypothetical protein